MSPSANDGVTDRSARGHPHHSVPSPAPSFPWSSDTERFESWIMNATQQPWYPIGYLITWTTYGTRLPGDPRGSVTRPENKPNHQHRRPNLTVQRMAQKAMRESPLVLSPEMRHAVHEAIEQLCSFRGWSAHAINVRTNHVHVVVSAEARAETVMSQMKSFGTRALRTAGMIGDRSRVWTKHGSTRYLFHGRDIERSVNYVVHWQ